MVRFVVGGWVAVGWVVFVCSALAFKGFSIEERSCVVIHCEVGMSNL